MVWFQIPLNSITEPLESELLNIQYANLFSIPMFSIQAPTVKTQTTVWKPSTCPFNAICTGGDLKNDLVPYSGHSVFRCTHYSGHGEHEHRHIRISLLPKSRNRRHPHFLKAGIQDHWNNDHQKFYWLCKYRMVAKSHITNTEPFAISPSFNHSNTGHVQYSDPLCSTLEKSGFLEVWKSDTCCTIQQGFNYRNTMV